VPAVQQQEGGEGLMVWFRMDDSFPSHPKVLGIPRRDRLAAVGLWTLAGGWCAKQLTDGYLAKHMLEEIGGSPRLASTLVEVGLWEVSEGGYQFHDWGHYNPTREEVEADRAAARERMKRIRSGRSSGGRSGEVRANNDRSSGEVRDPRPDPSRSSSGTTSGEPTAQTLVGEWIDHCQEKPPGKVVGQIAKEIKNMLDEGISYERVRAGLAAWQQRKVHPSVLPSIVHEMSGPPRASRQQSEVDDKFARAMDRVAGAQNHLEIA
jgi:hypothetical protein